MDKKEVDDALEMNFSGSRIGLYREGTDMMPIVVRPPENERHDINHLNNVRSGAKISNATFRSVTWSMGSYYSGKIH